MNPSLETFILSNQNSFYRLAFSYVKNKDDALDVVQESIYKAIKHEKSLNDSNAIKTWFYRIIVNTSLDLIRKNYKVLPVSGDEIEFCAETHEDKYDDIDLKNVLDNLPDKYKSIIIFRYFEDMKIEEIAQVLGENVNTVKTRLYEGLRRLRIYLKEPDI